MKRWTLLLLLSVPFSISAQYSTPGNSLAWNLDSLVVYSGGVVVGAFPSYTVNALVTVTATDTLNVSPGSDVTFTTSTAGLTVNGWLHAAGSSGDSIRFHYTTPDPNSWAGLRIDGASAGGTLEYCVVRDASTALYVLTCAPEITYCTFTNSSDPSGSGGTGQAVRFINSSAVFRYNRVVDNYRSGILASGSSLTIEDSYFSGCNLAPTAFRNRNHINIQTNSGTAVNATIRSNEIANGLAGGISLSNIYSSASLSGVIENNHIHDNSFGIACGGFGSDPNISVVIRDNIIDYNNINPDANVSGSGITLSGGATDQPVIARNVIRGNHWGVTVYLGQAQPRLGDLSNPDTTDDGRNRIYNNGNGGVVYNLYNNSPQTQKAENNFWGSMHPDTVESFIFHHPDSSVLGSVEYWPFRDTVDTPHLITGPVTGLGTTIYVGSMKDGSFTITNTGTANLTVALKDTFESAVSGMKGHVSSTFSAAINRNVSLDRALRAFRRMERPELPVPPFGPDLANDSVVVVDPANDFLGDPIGISGLVYPDVLKTSLRFGTFIYTYVDVEMYFNSAVDTNVLGVISWDVDQDFATGLFPSFSSLGLVPTDVGSEYELVFTTSPTLLPVPAAMIASTDTTFTPVATALSLTRSGPRVSFRLYAIPPFSFDNYLNANLASAYVTTDGIEALLSGDDSYAPGHIPDAAPDLGHMLRGVETNPSWIGMAVKADTVAWGDITAIDVTVVGTKPPGTYSARLVVTSNDPLHPRKTLPVTLTFEEEPLPVVNTSSFAISDTIDQNSGTEIPLTLSNTGAGGYRYLIIDTAQVEWLRIRPSFGLIEAGGEGEFTVSLFDSVDLPAGTYITHVLVISNDTTARVLSYPIELIVSPVSGIDTPPPGWPKRFALKANYPNPFNHETVISYQLPVNTHTTLTVYNLLGQQVRTLVNRPQTAGLHRTAWDGRDDSGNTVASGVYLYRLEAGDYVKTRKLMLLK
jgi:hypothetical protein